MAAADRYDPRKPDPEIDPDERYAFADGEEPKPEPEPVVPLNKPKKRRKRKDAGEVAEEHYDRILDREDTPERMPWWAAPVGLFFLGEVFIVAALIVLSLVTQNASAGVFVSIALAVAVAVEVLAVTGLLMIVGAVFGIEYGAAYQAVVRLIGLINYINGQTLLVSILCLPILSYFSLLFAVTLAGLTAYGLFLALFRLSVSEALITVIAILGSTVLLNFAIMGVLTAGR